MLNAYPSDAILYFLKIPYPPYIINNEQEIT